MFAIICIGLVLFALGKRDNAIKRQTQIQTDISERDYAQEIKKI